MSRKNYLPNHKEVIQFPSSGWRFFDYLEGESHPIDDWYCGLSEEGQDIFDALLKANRKIEVPLHWGGVKFLQGECKQERLWEWRFFADDRQQRLIGMFSDEQRKQAIFLIGCSHKGGNYTPTDSLRTAITRAKTVRKGALIHERKSDSNL
jgi:hypothetical protein